MIDLKNEDTIEQVYKSYFHPLRYYACKWVNVDEAEDVVGNVFLKVLSKDKRFPDTGQLRAYLYQAVHNACLDTLKVQKNTNRRHGSLYVNDIQESSLLQMMEAEVLGEIYRAINALPSQCGRIMQLSYVEGLNNREIADTMGLSEQTIKNQKHKGLSILRGKLSAKALLVLFLFLQ